MSDIYLDHIGIAVTENSKLGKLLELLGLPIAGQEFVASEKVNVEWVPLPVKPTKIELLQGSDSESAISKFLAKQKRDGVHHLSFRVKNLDKVSASVVAAGFHLVYPQARAGADHTRVNFIHPGSTGGVLVEITEKP